MIQEQHDDGADHCNKAGQEETRKFVRESWHQGAKQKSTHHRADQSQRRVDDAAFAAPVDDFAGDPSGQGAEENPTR